MQLAEVPAVPGPAALVGGVVVSGGENSVEDFAALLDRCRAQVEHDPSGYVENPHLYELLHKIFLRLCHGNVDEFEART
jgi:hypothetical protein